MTKNIFGFFSPVVIIALLATSVILFLKVNKLNQEINQTKSLIQKAEEETARLGSEKEKAQKENEKLQADTLSYLGINTRLQSEKEKLTQDLQTAEKLVEEKNAELEKANEKLLALEKKSKEQPAVQEKFVKEKKELEKKIKTLEETLGKERSLLNYNLGVAYAQAKLYDKALEAYEKSLEFYPANPEAHYNLGLLYENYQQDKEKAIEHYRKYLELKPDAEDKEEVTQWIERLKAGLSS